MGEYTAVVNSCVHVSQAPRDMLQCSADNLDPPQVDMMERMGLDVTVIDSPWGEGANEEKLAEILKVRAGNPASSAGAGPTTRCETMRCACFGPR